MKAMVRIGWPLLALLCGCIFDPSGLAPTGPSSDASADVTGVDHSFDPDASPLDGPRLELAADAPPIDTGSPELAFDTVGTDLVVPDVSKSDVVKPDVFKPDLFKPDAPKPDTFICVPTDCPLGCHSSLTRCNRLQPSNYDAKPLWALATANLFLNGTTEIVINSNGLITGRRSSGGPGTAPGGIYWNQVTQADGSPLAVFAVNQFVVAAGTPVRLAGTTPIAIYVRDTAEIGDLINAGADMGSPGPGGRVPGAKNGQSGAVCAKGEGVGGGTKDDHQSGGGGAGRGQAGAKGGDADTLLGGMGGLGLVAVPTALAGGCGGGAGGGPDPYGNGGNGGDGGSGGAGGGALQLSAGTIITIAINVGITAGGGGGAGGHYGAGGGGGGSGGTIILESPTVTVSGLVAVNGGGGGAGGVDWPVPSADNGKNGKLATTRAPGGVGQSFGGEGGMGGAVLLPTAGQKQYNGGGGGGGSGVILVVAYTAAVNASPTYKPSNQLNVW